MKRRYIPAVLLLLLAAGAALARNAPDFKLKDSDGNIVSLSSFRGKYVVVEFLLTTCPHCQDSAKVLEKVSKEFPETLQVIGVATDNGFQAAPDAIKEFKRATGATFPVLSADLMTGVNYVGVSPTHPGFRVPIFFVISPAGEVLEEKNADHPGDADFFANADANLAAMIRRIVPEKKTPVKKPPARKAKP